MTDSNNLQGDDVFGKVINNLITNITSANNMNSENTIEIETQFGYVDVNGKFQVGVRPAIYDRVVNNLKNKITESNITITNTTDTILGSIRQTVNETTNEKKYITKRGIWNSERNGGKDGRYLIDEYGIRINLSQEVIEKNINNEDKFIGSYNLIRNKYRQSFMIGNSRVDCTRVSVQSENRNSEKYEVEIELLKIDRDAIEQYLQIIYEILSYIQNSRVIYKKSEKILAQRTLMESINKNRNRSKNIEGIDYGILVQARNLKVRDMVYGGLIGNKKTRYTVSFKADGLRRLFVVARNGIWFLYPPDDAILITRNTNNLEVGSVLDGELIPIENRKSEAPSSIYWYLVFDCVMNRGDISIQKQPHATRMDQSLEIINSIKNVVDTKLLTISTKEFLMIDSVQQFYQTMDTLLSIINSGSLSYLDDGLIFTPEDVLYKTDSDNYPLSQRVLTQLPDICKWKPHNQLTIDFRINWRIDDTTKNKILNLQLYDIQTQKYVDFIGSDFFPFNGKIILNDIVNDKPTGTIIEFSWNSSQNAFEPKRLRSDKFKPNNMDIGLNIWSDIFNPITESTLLGLDINLMTSYHNRLKNYLFTLDNNISFGNRYLLDLTPDLNNTSYFNDYDVIFILESNSTPNPLLSNYNIIYVPTSLSNFDLSILQSYIRKNINSKFDTISVMPTIHSFWSSKQIYDNIQLIIKNTLKPNGKFLFFTFDQLLIQQAFNPIFGGTSYNNLPLTTINVNLSYSNNILTTQNPSGSFKSFPPNLTQFYSFLEPILIKRSTSEQFLNTSEIAYTSLLSYGYFLLLSNNPEIETIYKNNNNTYSVSLLQTESPIFHGILKALDPLYQENNDITYRRQRVIDLQKSHSLNSLINLLNIQVHVGNKIYNSTNSPIAIVYLSNNPVSLICQLSSTNDLITFF